MIEMRRKLLEEIGIKTPENKIQPQKWENISIDYTLSEEFIREFQVQLDWQSISSYQKMSEDFIREFVNKVCWYRIPTSQSLSDEFIIEFSDKVKWEFYFYYTEGSYPIMKKYISKTNHKKCSEFRTKHLTEKQKEEIERLLKLKNVFKI
jgi:hypothetical protein